MKLVVQPATREHIESAGGAVYVWARATRCCRGRTLVLESATKAPSSDFELVHAADGFRVYARVGMRQPDELHFELSRRGELRAYWNGQGWIG